MIGRVALTVWALTPFNPALLLHHFLLSLAPTPPPHSTRNPEHPVLASRLRAIFSTIVGYVYIYAILLSERYTNAAGKALFYGVSSTFKFLITSVLSETRMFRVIIDRETSRTKHKLATICTLVCRLREIQRSK